MKLNPVKTALLQLAQAVAELRRALPTNHALQARLAVAAVDVTRIAKYMITALGA